MIKYDWSNVPKNVNWIATDGDQNSWGFVTKEPFIGGEDFDQWVGLGWAAECKHIGFRVFKGDWRESLEERPNE